MKKVESRIGIKVCKRMGIRYKERYKIQSIKCRMKCYRKEDFGFQEVETCKCWDIDVKMLGMSDD